MQNTWMMRPLRSAFGLIRGVPLYLMQEQILFPRQRLNPADAERIRREHPDAEEIRLGVDGDEALHGWLVKPKNITRAPLLIYFAGNADEVSSHIDQRRQLGDHALLLMNYRGYGFSGGQPSEQALLDDAVRIFDAMVARPDVDSDRIAVLGRSLGSGVAVHLASQRPVSVVILTTPFDSIASVAQAHYPDVPVRRLLRHPFDSISRVAAVRQRAMFLVAESDVVIPLTHARRLYDAWPHAKSWHQVPGTTHADIVDHPSFWDAVSRFLETEHSSARAD